MFYLDTIHGISEHKTKKTSWKLSWDSVQDNISQVYIRLLIRSTKTKSSKVFNDLTKNRFEYRILQSRNRNIEISVRTKESFKAGKDSNMHFSHTCILKELV